ncbi:MAG TPA: glycosyltransferase [Polyangium sp.]|nr:glycosyltransferase [Polyangium sp.]
MKLAVIMRTKNADWVVEQALRSLHSQTIRNFEFVVVDSGSTDRTLEIVRGYGPTLIRIPASSYIPGAVLNRAIKATASDILVYQNSDAVLLSPFVLERLVRPFQEPAVMATFARQIPRPEAQAWVRRDYEVSFPADGDAPSWLPYSLPFAAMRRSAWELHPFHTAAWGSEDIEWGTWARSRGHIVRYVPNAMVMHSHNYTLRELFGRRFIEGEADAFIHQDNISPAETIRRTLRSTAGDILYHARLGDWTGLAELPLRRAVFHVGYHYGRVHGERQRAGLNADKQRGQRYVLERFGGAGAREDR